MVRILADDLSGALDAAGPFARADAPVSVYWDPQLASGDAGPRVALDTATREAGAERAAARARIGARALWGGRAGVAFKKVDSVWRGSPAAEIAAVCDEIAFARVVVAPAFPQQGRVTRGGAQWVADGEGWRVVENDIVADLRRHGIDAARETFATPSTRAVVCDAETPAELDAIVARHQAAGARTLWCGTSGLARALASRLASAAAPPRSPGVSSDGGVLVVVGTDHPVSLQQSRVLEGAPGVVCRTVDAVTHEMSLAGGRAPDDRVVLLRFRLPERTPRDDARRLIAEALAVEASRLPRPGLAVVTGGETVRSLCEALGATRLDVVAEREPGIPVARMRDGRWAGTAVLSKSGGFGSADLFLRIAGEAVGRTAHEDGRDDQSCSHRR